jgi:type IV secretion system protein VirB9
MIRTTLLRATLLAATALLSAASAAQARDARLASRLYDPDEVVRIDGRAGVQATIAFADDEHIENVAVGDSTTWQITPNKRANLLFVKPLTPRARTNMTVVTDRHTYLFDLVAALAGNPLYVLRFTYPEPARGEQVQAPVQAMTEAEAQAAAATPAEAPADPATLNFAWAAKGSGKLLPARIYDDGAATFIAWGTATPIPAILIRNDKGEEGPVNFAVRGDVIVIDGVPGLIVLRAGRDSAVLENKGAPRKAAPPPQAALAAAAAVPQADQKGQ